MCTKKFEKYVWWRLYNQLDFECVENLKFECYRTTAVLWKHSQCKMIWWTYLCHLLTNNGFYIYSRTAGYRFQTRVSRQHSSPVNQNYVCFMNDRELKSAFLSNNLNTVLAFKVTILGKNVGFLWPLEHWFNSNSIETCNIHLHVMIS